MMMREGFHSLLFSSMAINFKVRVHRLLALFTAIFLGARTVYFLWVRDGSSVSPKREPNIGAETQLVRRKRPVCELKGNKREQTWPGTGMNDVRNIVITTSHVWS